MPRITIKERLNENKTKVYDIFETKDDGETVLLFSTDTLERAELTASQMIAPSEAVEIKPLEATASESAPAPAPTPASAPSEKGTWCSTM